MDSRQIENILKMNGAYLDNYGLEIPSVDCVKIMVGENDFEKDIPKLEQPMTVTIYGRECLIIDLRGYKLKEGGSTLKELIPKKSLALYAVKKAIIVSEYESGDLNATVINATLKALLFILGNTLMSNLKLDNIDNSILMAYLASKLVLSLYEDRVNDNEILSIVNRFLSNDIKNSVDIELMLNLIKDKGSFEAIKYFKDEFGSSVRLARLTFDDFQVALGGLTMSMFRRDIILSIDNPIYFLPVLIEHMDNIMYKRTKLFFTINKLKKFIDLDTIKAYDKQITRYIV
jgi:hypothetical protein